MNIPGKPNATDEYRFRRYRGIVLQRELRDFATWLGKRLGFRVVADGIEVRSLSDGFALKGAAGGACDPDHPWKLRVIGSAGTGTVTVAVSAGLVDDVEVDAEELEVTATGLVRIYALVSGTLAASESYVIGGTVTTVALDSTTGPLPDATSGAGEFTAPLLIGLIEDGAVSSQQRFTALQLGILNAGSPPDGTATILFGRA